MEEGKGKLALWIALAVIVGLLLTCMVAGLAGSVAGYFAGKRAASLVRQPELFGRRALPVPRLPEIEVPIPEIPEEFPQPDVFPWRGGGALVVTVTEDGPADDAGLRPGDVIVEVDGEPLGEDDTLAERISLYEPGDELELQIIRRGRERTIKVGLGRHPDRGGKTPWLGIEYQSLPDFRFRIEVPERGERGQDPD